jgi:hypothetical protein
LATFGLDLRLFGLFSPASSESPFGRNQKAEAEGEPISYSHVAQLIVRGHRDQSHYDDSGNAGG